MKKGLGYTLIVLAVLAWFGRLPWGQYHWLATVTADAGSDWTVAATSDNAVDLTQPWTWVSAPVSSAVFVAVSKIERDSGGHVYAPTVWRYDRSLASLEDHGGWYAADCPNRRLAKFDSTSAVPNWHQLEPRSPGEQLFKFLCASSSN